MKALHQDTSWAHHENLWADFADPRNYILALIAKQIISSYYAQVPNYSYFIDCLDDDPML